MISASYLAVKDDLTPFLSLSSDVSDTDATLSNLTHLHYLVELAVLTKTFLSPGQESLRGIIQQVIKEKSSESSSLVRFFSKFFRSLS